MAKHDYACFAFIDSPSPHFSSIFIPIVISKKLLKLILFLRGAHSFYQGTLPLYDLPAEKLSHFRLAFLTHSTDLEAKVQWYD
ncbi:hypothetical protein LguiB_027410 [Lonicera macranthoides]